MQSKGENMTETRRGKNVAVIGTICQLVFTAALLAMWLLTRSQAAMTCTWVLGGGVPLWLMAAILFYCRQLAAREEAELAEIAARGEAGTIFEGESDAAMRPAAVRLAAMERWVVPIFTVLWAVAQAAVGLLVIRSLAATDEPPQVIGTGPGALFAVLIAFSAFLLSRYSTGLGTERVWRLLRATGSYLLVNVLLIAGVLAALLAATQNYMSADRIIAFAAPVVQLLLAVELVLNVILDFYRPRVPGQEDRPPFDSRLFNLVAQPGRVGHTIAETLNYQFGFEVSKTWFYQLLSRAMAPLVGLGIVVMFLLSAVVIVPAGHQAIVFHFGVPSRETLKAGIGLKWPWPIDRAEVFDTAQIHEILLGAGEERADKERAESFVNGHRLSLWTAEHGDREELDFLVAVPPRGKVAADDGADDVARKPVPSVDIIKLVVPVHYRIVNPFKYGYSARDSGALLEHAAYREMVRYCASATLTTSAGKGPADRPEAIMTTGRGRAARELRKRIQTAADELGLGVEIVYTGLVAVHPPASVAPAFQDVLRAERAQDEKRYVAQGNANAMLAEVAGTPAEARKLALAIRVLEELQGLQNQRSSGGAGLGARLADHLARARADLAAVDEDIRQKRILGRRPAVRVDYRKELVAYIDMLDEAARDPGGFDYAARIDKARRLADRRLDRAGGRSAQLLARARSYRWTTELKERGRYESFGREMLAYDASPRTYMIDRWLDVWDEVLPGITKYVLAVDREKLEVRLNLEKPLDPMGGVLPGGDTGQ